MTLQERTPVPILQNEWEFDQLLDIYHQTDGAQKVLEIGTFFGGTLYHWLKCPKNPQEITCVDLPIDPSDGRYQMMIESRGKWIEWLDRFNLDKPEILHKKINDIKGDSTDPGVVKKVRELYPEKDVDFLFIDGDHSYEGVKADYDNYHILVKSGGLIVFHDIVGYWTVKKFWDEVKIGKKYKEICNSGPEGWGIGILYV